MSEWISVEDKLPGAELLNRMGRCKFLCVVNYTGTMINVTGIDVFMFSEYDGFLASDKGALKASISHWMPLPDIPNTTNSKGE